MAAITFARLRTRVPLSALARTTIGALAGIALVLGYVAVALLKSADPMIAVMIGLPLLAAGLIATGWRWAPALGAVLSALLSALMVVIAGEIPQNLGGPLFAPLVALAGLALAGLVAGTAAVVQNYRRPAEERRTPRALPFALVALAAFVAGLTVLGSMPQPGVRMGISDSALASLPAVTLDKYQGGEIRIKAGQVIMMRLENGDFAAHSFDVDQLGVHAPMPAGEDGLAVFAAPAPGTYTFYCAPHYDKASGRGMHGTLVVE